MSVFINQKVHEVEKSGSGSQPEKSVGGNKAVRNRYCVEDCFGFPLTSNLISQPGKTWCLKSSL